MLYAIFVYDLELVVLFSSRFYFYFPKLKKKIRKMFVLSSESFHFNAA